jgi:TonB-dependent Receptor Plug Domain
MHDRCTTVCFAVLLLCSGLTAPRAQSEQHADIVEPAHADDSSSVTDTVPASAANSAESPASAQPLRPASLFDAVKRVTTTVEVHAADVRLETSSPAPMTAGGEDVINSAGTHGDISRYIQLLPGVVASSDYSNQILVRGGHPMENLFLVDGIEVPNINHLANANTTGGFGPMIDAAVIQGLNFYTGGFDAKYPERLSSVTEFQTLESNPGTFHAELDLGVQGIGGLTEKHVAGGDLLVSAHHGLINLVSKDVGIDGVPAYTNEFTRYRRTNSDGSRFTLLNVAGWDSIAIEPCASNPWETTTINSSYSGWRETTGVEWQRVYSPRSYAVMDVSDSEQVEHIHQSDQMVYPREVWLSPVRCPIPKGTFHYTPVYKENSNNAFSSAKYRYEWAGSGFSVSAGSAVWLQRPSFEVAQPEGAFSPYSYTPTRSDSNSFERSLSTGETGSYAQFVAHPRKSLTLSGGGRVQTFAFGAHTTLTPRISADYGLGEKAHIHVAYANYAQMPPYAYLLAYRVNQGMEPMRVVHEIAGLEMGFVPASQVRLEAYNKVYRDIPASTEYSPVTMHTMVDMIGEQSVWLPMTSEGRGEASGIELSDRSRIGSRVQLMSSVAYARAKFAGRDGVLRPSNFDFPWIVNASGVVRLGRGMIGSGRYGYATGRPYTPFDMAQSAAQNRPVYDLARVNGARAPFYSRLDLQVSKEMLMRGQRLEIYLGVDNVLNRSNLLSYAWMPRSQVGESRDPVGTLWQTPIFPNFGVRLILR